MIVVFAWSLCIRVCSVLSLSVHEMIVTALFRLNMNCLWFIFRPCMYSLSPMCSVSGPDQLLGDMTGNSLETYWLQITKDWQQAFYNSKYQYSPLSNDWDILIKSARSNCGNILRTFLQLFCGYFSSIQTSDLR